VGPDGVFLYFDLALSNHCGFFRASVFLERSLLAPGTLRNLRAGASMRWLSSMYRRTTSWLLVYPHSFTRVYTSKRFDPRHCALQMCSVARNFSHQTSMCVIWTTALINLGFSAWSAQHLAPSTIAPTKVLFFFHKVDIIFFLLALIYS